MDSEPLNGDILLPVPERSTLVNGPSEGSQYFHRLLEILADENGRVAVLEAYFDASVRDSKVICVAGLAFTARRAKSALAEWTELWPQPFRMSKFNAREKPFDKFTNTTRDARMKDMVAILNRYSDFKIAVSCSLDDVQRLVPSKVEPGFEFLLDGLGTAYGLCLHMAMHALGSIAGADDGIAYFIEEGDLHQGRARVFIDRVIAVPAIKASYNVSSYTFATKSKLRIFEAADLFCWEWAKQRDMMALGKPMRKSLQALLGDGYKGSLDFASNNTRAFYMRDEGLSQFYRRLLEFFPPT